MPYTYTIDPAARLVTVLAEGEAGFDESVALMRTLIADPLYRPDYALLADLRASSYVASGDEARAFRVLFDEMRGRFRGRIAVVVSDLVRFGVTRMVAQMVEASGITMNAFRDLDAARVWLGAHPT